MISSNEGKTNRTNADKPRPAVINLRTPILLADTPAGNLINVEDRPLTAKPMPTCELSKPIRPL